VDQERSPVRIFHHTGTGPMSQKPLAIVAGSGPGLGLHMVKHFSTKGYNAVGMNRSVPPGDTRTVVSDLANGPRLQAQVKDVICAHGAPRLVVHNPAKLIIAPFEETEAEDFEATWRAMVLSAVNLAKVVLPVMVESGGGTFIVSGATASLRGGANFSAFSSAKAGLRALSQSLAKEYGPKGVHVAHVILDGILDTQASRDLHDMDPARMMKLDDVAGAYLALAQQPKSAWSFETDLRPMGESF
jgi:NAD(P)-dependent dehydrogenase (short-subunit alcohol dehydrogenase family)